MRVLLDESLPRPLARLLAGHDVTTVVEAGWASFENGALLRAATATFDVLITADQNLEHQQNLNDLPMAVLVLVAESNRLESLAPLIPAVLDSLRTLKPRRLLRVGA
jgi:predicted nuclease of predicted toxin-antitoxin system